MRIHLHCSTTPRSRKARSTLNSASVPSDFHLLGFFEEEKRTINFLAFLSRHEEELKLSWSTTKANYSDKNHRIKNSSLERLFRSTEITHCNRPFPSSLVPPFQSESKCETILMKMTFICMKKKLRAELIFI